MTAYELESVRLPKLTGRSLKMLARALESPATRTPVSTKLLADAGITKLRGRAFDEAPRFMPLSPVESPHSDLGALDLGVLDAMALPNDIRSAASMVASFREGSTSPVEVAEKALSAIADADAHRHPLRCFIAIDPDDVMAQAKASAERYAHDRTLGPLDGVPVAIKDEVDQVPYPTTAGTRILGQEPAEEDATTVARLRAAGAVLLGKANMHEIGINPNGLNVHYGVVRNPVDRSRDPGGSSSGPAAAVAAGFCPLALGADGGGSIRIPAALCGVVGVKATFGRISEHGAVPLCWSVAHIGPIGATVHDAALGYALMAGPDPADPNTLVQPAVDPQSLLAEELPPMRIGVYRPWFEHAQPEIVQACERAIGLAQSAGAEVREVDIPELDEMRIAHAITILSEMATSMSAHTSRLTEFGSGVRINLALGRLLHSSDYVKAQQMRARAMRIFEEVFQACDVVATPATAVTAPPIPDAPLPHGWSDLSTVTELMRFIIPGNLCGLPALTLPVGADSNGLPIGLQLMANHWREDRLFQLASVIERAYLASA
jgi:Asp-tRNA(Asn)/Glu-tRNA(Gln) amidotransferase A subunit family amidase